MAHYLGSPGALFLSDRVSSSVAGTERDVGKEQRRFLEHSLLLVIYAAVYRRRFCRPKYVNEEQQPGTSFPTLRLSVSFSYVKAVLVFNIACKASPSFFGEFPMLIYAVLIYAVLKFNPAASRFRRCRAYGTACEVQCSPVSPGAPSNQRPQL